ncbi:hypothetical protein M2138_001387 [Dysgonomonadaceae bacterium PH5-43]|nr:hypothetical protein [Dysgonomonadaceae bacterium PH5-43]
MTNCLSIVLRNQFNLFYRFGCAFIPKCTLIYFDGNITEKVENQIIEQFETTTPFEYDEEYLILHLEINNSQEANIEVGINDIVKIYPLSKQAKKSIESKIDPRIRLENPIFESLLSKIEVGIQNREVNNAIQSLWTICKIEKPLEDYLLKLGFENIIKGLEHRKNGTKADEIQNGNYWEYLIAYDRHEYFSKSMLGYFYDAGLIFAHSKGQPTFEGSKVYGFLEQLNMKDPQIESLRIIDLLEKSEDSKGYISQNTKDNIKQYIIAPLYLKLKDEIRNSEDITQTNLIKKFEILKKEFGDSFLYSIILLGAFFGFRKFYDLYYDSLNLRFYKKSNIEHPAPKDKQSKETSDDKTNLLRIIHDVLNGKSEIPISNIIEQIKKETGRKVSNKYIKEIIKDDRSITIGKIGRKDTVKLNSNGQQKLNF